MRVLIAAGGTAGHINPALAIAGAIKQHCPEAEIHFAGRKAGMEFKLVGQAGYPFHHIEVNGIQRSLTPKNILRNIEAVWHLALSGPRAKAMMRQVQPDLVIGCGGYVSGPVVRCAAKMGIKTAIHEQNAFPGVTNKLLAKDVDVIFAAVPAAVEKLGAPGKTTVVGNPVRPEIFAQDRAAARAKLKAGDRTVILSFGGSLGARRINEVVADLAAWEQKQPRNILHLHATGSRGVELFKNLAKEKGFCRPGQGFPEKFLCPGAAFHFPLCVLRVCHILDGFRYAKYYKAYGNFILVRITKNDLSSFQVFEHAILQKMMIRDCSSFEELKGEYIRFCIMMPEDNNKLVKCLGEILA